MTGMCGVVCQITERIINDVTVDGFSDGVPIFEINESHRDVAIADRVEFVHVIRLALLIKLREEFSQHEDNLLRFDARGVRGEASDVRVENGDLVEVICEVNLLRLIGEQELIANVVW